MKHLISDYDPLTLKSSGYQTMLGNFPRDKFFRQDTFSSKPLKALYNEAIRQALIRNAILVWSLSLNEPFLVIKYDESAIKSCKKTNIVVTITSNEPYAEIFSHLN